jgi:hypothetical protein
MQLIEIEDLDAGDEILISCQGCFKYLRLLRKPAIGTKKHWSTGKPVYKSVKCSTSKVTKINSYVYNGVPQVREYTDWGFGPDDHNFEQYVNLNYRQIILVRKK